MTGLNDDGAEKCINSVVIYHFQNFWIGHWLLLIIIQIILILIIIILIQFVRYHNMVGRTTRMPAETTDAYL